jgi:GH43 family beta-xylosidase
MCWIAALLALCLSAPALDPLNDPNRHARVQAFGWRADGFPDFGTPFADGPYSI